MGISALKSVTFTNSGVRVKMPSKKGFKLRPVGFYLYRKLFYDYNVDPTTKKVFYSLNKTGIDYKMSMLDNNLKNIEDLVRSAVNTFNELPTYNNMLRHYKDRNSADLVDLSYPQLCRYPKFKKLISENFDEKIRDYALYKKIYEFRYYSTGLNAIGRPNLELNPCSDYRYFLDNTHFTVEYNPNGSSVVYNTATNLLVPYYSHPRFRDNMQLFACFDFLVDYKAYCNDKKYREDAEEKRRLKNKFKLIENGLN